MARFSQSKPRLLCFSASTRRGSTTYSLLQNIAERHNYAADFHFYDGLRTLPHFDPDAEDQGVPEIVQKLREEISHADAVIIGTPEYVFSVPAILKNALEWCVASTVFTDKPTALIVAASAGEKTFEQLSLILKTIQCRIEPSTMLHVKGARTKLHDKELSDQLDSVFHATLSLMKRDKIHPTQ